MMLKFHKHQHTCDQEANEDEQGLTLSQVVHDNHLFEFISESLRDSTPMHHSVLMLVAYT